MSHPLTTSLPDVNADPRFEIAVQQFNRGEYYEAADGFEELFFEAVRDEVEFVRMFLQLSVGAYHVECGQRRPAVERLDEAILALDRVTNRRGFDLSSLREEIILCRDQLTRHAQPILPRITRSVG